MSAAGAENLNGQLLAVAARYPGPGAKTPLHRRIGLLRAGSCTTTGSKNGIKAHPSSTPPSPPRRPKALIDAMKKHAAKPGPISRPTYVPFFAEPQIGNITTASGRRTTARITSSPMPNRKPSKT